MHKVKNVTVFSTTWCPYCKMEASWLREKKVAHKTVLVDEDNNAAMYMVANTGQQGVPVTEIEFEDGSSKFVVGFDRTALSTLLDV